MRRARLTLCGPDDEKLTVVVERILERATHLREEASHAEMPKFMALIGAAQELEWAATQLAGPREAGVNE